MHQTELYINLWENRFDGIAKAEEVVNRADKQVAHAPGLLVAGGVRKIWLNTVV
jgi:hypothetical protein